jgi:RimJ/RimL family protein N-acetyltransferase
VETPTLHGKYVRLEPLDHCHCDGLAAAAAEDPSLYLWSPVPQNKDAARLYIDTALAWRDAGNALAFATIRVADGAVVGSTRFFDIERWAWPQGHPRHGRGSPDACEIGYTWLAGQMLRVCLHTDARNQISRAAIERIGGKFEGILRAHRMAADFIARDSARFSIVAAEWPELKLRLAARLRPS